MLSPEEIKLCIMSEIVTGEVLSQGHNDGYKANGWLKGVDHHIPAAIGHAIDADRMRRGLKAEDAEGIELHLSHALTRIAMALYCVREEKRRNDSPTIPADLVGDSQRERACAFSD